jgi:hypothetical protein
MEVMKPFPTMMPLQTIFLILFSLVLWQAFLILLIKTRKIDSRLQSPFGAIVFLQAVGVLVLLVDAIHRWLNQ